MGDPYAQPLGAQGYPVSPVQSYPHGQGTVQGQGQGVHAPVGMPHKAPQQQKPKVAAEQPPPKPFLTKAKEKFIAHHLVIFLAIAFTVGLSWPLPGDKISSWKVGDYRVVPSLMIFIIFFISGMRLKTDDVLSTLKDPFPLLLGFFLILVVTPCVGFIPSLIPQESVEAVVAPGNYFKWSEQRSVTLSLTVPELDESIPKEILIGFAVFCCVPTTLTSGAALVSQGASRATVLALMITSSTNLIGTVSVPFVLKLVLADIDVSLEATSLLIKLLFIMLLPSVLGKLLTQFVKPTAVFAKEQKVPLTVFSGFLLVGTVWQSLSRSQEKIVEQSAATTLSTIGAGIGLHFVFWLINGFVMVLPCIHDVHQRRAVFLLSSQKTLPVSVAVISALATGALEKGEVINEGLVTLPCIMGHLSQLVIDSFLINYWKGVDAKAEKAKVPEAEEPLLAAERSMNGTMGGGGGGGGGGAQYPNHTNPTTMPSYPDGSAVEMTQFSKPSVHFDKNIEDEEIEYLAASPLYDYDYDDDADGKGYILL